MLRKKRSNRRNDGGQTANVAPDRFDSTEARNDFSEILPTVNLGSEPILQTQASSTPSVNAPDNTRKNTPKTLAKDFRRKKIHQKQSFKTPAVTTPDSDLQIIEVREETRSQPLEKIIIWAALWKQNSSPAKKHWHSNRNNEHLLMCNCPVEPKKQAAEESSPRKTEPGPTLNVAAHPRQWEDGVPSFSLGISPASSQLTPPSQVTLTQPTQPSEPTVLELEVLVDAVVDAGVMAPLKFAEATSVEPSFTAIELYKTSEKNKEITEELKEKCYHLMTHVKETIDTTDEYDPLFILNYQENFEGFRHHFMYLMPEQHVENTVVNTHCMILNDMKCLRFEKDIYCVPTDIVMFMLGNHGEKYIDPKTKKAYRFDVDRYAHQRHWWLWIADVRKKAFYVLDPVNKNKNKIPDLRIKLNKFVGLIISQMRVYAGVEPLIEDGDGEEAEYIRLNSQRTSYDCGIYVMKWLEILILGRSKVGRGINIKLRKKKRLILSGLNMVQIFSSTN
ncbi:uncharacterized protein DS421_15g503540 [Arachis hypogaea]|nr:uncharacterized protein DS421_15g503540 [Arachis hypogaea]